jgi:tetratricopeptide (TPR) repeat protein
MKIIISLLLAALVLAPAMPGWTQPLSLKEARASYEEGARHYDLGEYAEALASFRDAYRAKDDPAFLFNIAQCLRKLNRLDEASYFYRSYLRRAPDADNREKVERHLKDIEDQAAAASPPSASNQGPSPKQFSAHDIPIAPAPQIDLAPQPPSVIKVRPIYERWWFWAATGAVAAGTTAAIIILARHDPTSIPASALGSQRTLP